MMLKSNSTQVKRKQKKSSEDTQKKATKLSAGVFLKGTDKKGWILIQDNGNCYQDMALTVDELHELYCLLESKFGEFMGYRIK